MNTNSSSFQLWPSIDLIDGKPVRLRQGDFAHKTEYDHPLTDLAETFSRFASGIHVVDLDGAKQGKITHYDAIAEIAAAASIPSEVGGGVRELADIDRLLALGVARVVIGTSAVTDPTFLSEAIDQFGADKIVVGADIKNGYVATNAWQQSSQMMIDTFLTTLKSSGIRTVSVTEIARDGTLSGPPVELYRNLKSLFPHLEIIASGGISNIADLRLLRGAGIAGAIFGKAYYEGMLTLDELLDFINEPC